MPLATTIQVSLSPVLTGAASEFSATPRFAPSVNDSLSWETGTGASQADLVWADQARSINATTNDDLDLAGGLTDGLGATVTMARLKLIYIKNNETTAGRVIQLGGSATNPVSTLFGATPDYLTIPPGGIFCLAVPDATAFAVTGGSADTIRIRNPNASAITYDIILIGASA